MSDVPRIPGSSSSGLQTHWGVFPEVPASWQGHCTPQGLSPTPTSTPHPYPHPHQARGSTQRSEFSFTLASRSAGSDNRPFPDKQGMENELTSSRRYFKCFRSFKNSRKNTPRLMLPLQRVLLPGRWQQPVPELSPLRLCTEGGPEAASPAGPRPVPPGAGAAGPVSHGLRCLLAPPPCARLPQACPGRRVHGGT